MNKTAEIRQIAADLLQREKVQFVVGWEQGTHDHVRPAFIYDAGDVERLIWDQRCTHNLVRYIHKHKDDYLAVVVKPCDARAVNILLAENKLNRERIFIIGLKCEGVSVGGELQHRCQVCTERTPVIYDRLVGDEPAVVSHDTAPATVTYHTLDQRTPTDKMEFWLDQFDQCIRCFACRQACPVCSCPTCLYERNDYLWVGAGLGVTEKRSFHLGRALHLAGRCVGCNECERVCPVQLPISMLNQKLYEVIQTRFDFTPGLTEELTPLTTVLGPKEVHA